MTATPAIPSLDALGRALEYPGADLAARWEACRAALTPAHPAAARRVADALDRLAVSSTEEFEEIYARAFDLSNSADRHSLSACSAEHSALSTSPNRAEAKPWRLCAIAATTG